MAKKIEANAEIDGLVSVLNILREERDNGNFEQDPFMVFLKIVGEPKYQQALKRVDGLSKDVRNNALSSEHMAQAMAVVQCCAQTLSVEFDDEEELYAAGRVLKKYLSR